MIRLKGSGQNDVITANLLHTTIDGDAGDDLLIGRGHDLLLGGDGNDRLLAGSAGSYMDGGAGNDSLTDGNSADVMLGGDGNDIILSSYGDDWIDGGAGNDSITVNIKGGAVSTYAAGGAGNDYITIATSSSIYSQLQVEAGDGDDVIELVALNGVLDIRLGSGVDTLRLDRILQTPSSLSVIHDFQAGAGGDRIDFEGMLAESSAFANNTVNPFASGKLTLIQSGADTYVRSGNTTLLILLNVSAASLTAYNLGGYASNGTIEAASTFTGTSGDDLLYGASGADIVHGGIGRDTLLGGMGDDILYGEEDNDTLFGNSGADRLEGGAGNDVLHGGAGTDILIGGDGNDSLLSERGSDTLDGGEGNDGATITTVSGDVVHATMGAGTDSASFFAVAGSSVFLDMGADADRVTFNYPLGAIELTLGAGADLVTLNGVHNGSGSLVFTDFETGDGGDRLDLTTLLSTSLSGWGGATNPFGTQNLRLVQNGADTLLQIDATAGAGQWKTVATLKNTDASAFTALNFHGLAPDGSAPAGLTLAGGNITGTIGPDTITGTANGDLLNGGAGDDTIAGNAGIDTINGGAGADTIDGGAGNDTIDGGLGVDTIHGGDGADTVGVGSGADIVHGDEGDDQLGNNAAGAHLFGDGGNDVLTDQGGANELDGGEGDDSLQLFVPNTQAVTVRGGAGDDVLWSYGSGTPTLTIDMGAGHDRLELISFASATVTLGSEADGLSVGMLSQNGPAASLVVTDFTAGAAGDWLGLTNLLSSSGGTWNYAIDPFAAGYVRLVQSGSDVQVQIDRDAGATAYGFVTYVLLQNIDAAALTRENLGFGTASADVFDLRAGAPGDWFGFDGDDVFYLGAGFASPLLASGGGRADLAGVDGGSGADTVILQGDYSGGLFLEERTLSQVDTLRLLSHSDASWGGEGPGPFSYVLETDGSGVEEALFVDGSGLGADEGLSFDGAGEVGTLHIAGGLGADEFLGGDNDDLLEGGGGDDVLDGGYGADTMAGGDGSDSYLVEDGGDLVVEQAGAGTDTVLSLIESYVLTANVETLIGGLASGQVLIGNALGNVIIGSVGSDILDGGAGADTLIGGAGDDLYYVDSASDTVVEAAGEGYDEVHTLVSGYVMPDNVEKLIYAGIGAGDIRGNSGDNILAGGDGNDFLRLQDGGDDTASGGAGGDAFYFGAAFTAADQVDGGAGKDVIALQGDYSGGVVLGSASLVAVETLSLLSHIDTRFGGGSASGFSYVLTSVDLNVAAGQQLIVNGSSLEAGENLSFNGAAESNGSFFIYGGKGIDTLTGGSGADVFFFAEDGRFGAGDHVDGGAGNDVLVLRGDYAIVMDGLSMTNIETVTLMSGADARFAPAGSAFHYDITTAENSVAAGQTMTFNGGGLGPLETLQFNGSAESDGAFRIFGGNAADTITGGGGNDLIYGGLGADALKGRAGADVFRYQSVTESTASAIDHILDFASGDRIDVSRAGAFHFIGSDAFGGHAGELRVDHAGNAWTVSADLDGDGNADLTIAVTVTDNHDLVAGDFMF